MRAFKRNLSGNGIPSAMPTGFDGAPPSRSGLVSPSAATVAEGSGMDVAVTRRARAPAVCADAISSTALCRRASAIASRRDNCSVDCEEGGAASDCGASDGMTLGGALPGCADAETDTVATTKVATHHPRMRRMCPVSLRLSWDAAHYELSSNRRTSAIHEQYFRRCNRVPRIAMRLGTP